MPPDYSTWQRSGRLERRGFEIKPSDKPIIITVAVIGGVFAILALFWIARCVRRKPAAPLPPARPLSTYYGSGSTDALSAKRDAPNASPGSDTSSWHGGISRDAKFSSSGTSTPTQGLLRTLEMSETDPEYVAALHKDRPRLPWTHAPGSSVSLASSSNASSSAAVVPDFTPISGSSTSPSPSLTPVHPNSLAQQDTNRARHQSGNSISKHSIVSVQSRHSIRAPNSLSRNSLYTPPPSAVRGAPHKTGIQIILPEPLGPQSHVPGGGVPVRSSSRSSTLGGHQSKRFSQSDSWTDFQLDKMARNRVGIHGVDEGNNRGRELVDREGRPLTILSDASGEVAMNSETGDILKTPGAPWTSSRPSSASYTPPGQSKFLPTPEDESETDIIPPPSVAPPTTPVQGSSPLGLNLGKEEIDSTHR